MLNEILRCGLSFLINLNASKYEVDPRYVAAIVYQESARGSKNLLAASVAYRFEKGFYRDYIEGKALTGFVPEGGHETSERYARAASFGLMQVLGATARENGLREQYVSALVFPWINIQVGTSYFAKLLKDEGGNYTNALRRYNGNINNPDTLKYAQEVESHIESGRIKAVLL